MIIIISFSFVYYSKIFDIKPRFLKNNTLKDLLPRKIKKRKYVSGFVYIRTRTI